VPPGDNCGSVSSAVSAARTPARRECSAAASAPSWALAMTKRVAASSGDDATACACVGTLSSDVSVQLAVLMSTVSAGDGSSKDDIFQTIARVECLVVVQHLQLSSKSDSVFGYVISRQ
jgi:hypothetical protein